MKSNLRKWLTGPVISKGGRFLQACLAGEPEVVASFLETEPSWAVAKAGPEGWTPIEYACLSPRLQEGESGREGIRRVVGILLRHGADPDSNHRSPETEPWPQTVLFAVSGIANDPELTRLLLEAGADVNELLPEPDPTDPARSPWGPEAIYHSSEHEDVACLRLLLEAKPRPIYVSYCLARALDFENPAMAACFLEHGADPNFRVPWARNRTHLHKAIASGRGDEIVALLLQAGGDPAAADLFGMTPYREAARRGRRAVTDLFDRSGSFSATDEDLALGCLMRGETSGSPILRLDPELFCAVAREGNLVALRGLLNAGAEVNQAGGGDMPPLHQAAWWGQYDAFRMLLEEGADPHLRNVYGGNALGTALHGSVHCDFNRHQKGGEAYARIVEDLLAAGMPLPAKLEGSAAVQEVLLRHGMS